VSIKICVGLGFELVRVTPILHSLIRRALCNLLTARDKRETSLGMRPIDDPGWMQIHKVFAQDMLVVSIGVVFAVIAPLVLVPCIVFCVFSRVLWTHQYLYVYENCCETGGLFWPVVFRRSIFALLLAQATILGQFMLKGAWLQVYCVGVLMIGTYVYLRKQRAMFDAMSQSLPLEVASIMDSTAGDDPEQPASELVRDSYLHPALRALPSARPEPVEETPRAAEDGDSQYRIPEMRDVTLTFEGNDEAWTRAGDGDWEEEAGVQVRTVSDMPADEILEMRWAAELGREKTLKNTLLVLAGVRGGGLGCPDMQGEESTRYSKLI